MKKVIWVLQNIKGTLTFYDELTLMMLVASVCSWRNQHQSFNELHVDSLTRDILSQLDVLHLWDSVVTDIVDSESPINLESFWASSKVKVLKEQTEPVTIVDNDLFAYTNLLQYDTAPVVYSHDEDGKQWYFDASDEYVGRIKSIPADIIYTPNRSALNVCYLSFTDLHLQQQYADWSYKVMVELSEMGAPKGAHMTYAEQKLLKQIIVNQQLEYRTLISNIYQCGKFNFDEQSHNDRGVWSYSESKTKYWHVGFEKTDLKKKPERMDFLYRIVARYIPIDEMKERVQNVLSFVQ